MEGALFSLSMSALLEVQNLCAGYNYSRGKEALAIRCLSFAMRSGEVLGVIGESGSGKSTLAMALLALLPANGRISGGSILLEGENLLEKTPAQLRQVRGSRIAHIFQEPSLALHPTKSIEDQVTEVLRAHFSLKYQERSRRVREALEAVFGPDAPRIASSYPHELSGGQRQRAVIAQAIVCRPRIIVADEPTASLDTVTQHAILTLFCKLQKWLNLAIIFITHNPALLAGFADRILVLYAGNAVELGPANEVLTLPKHPYTGLLLECAPRLEKEDGSHPAGTIGGHSSPSAIRMPTSAKLLPVIPGEAPDFFVKIPGCRFVERCPRRMEVCARRPPSPTRDGNLHEVSCFLFGG
jgi:oligopeptide/dipeptide ABC transporter ATP-binding protein